MIDYIDSSNFTYSLWRAGSPSDFGIICRTNYIFNMLEYRNIIKKYAIGYCNGENLLCRPKINTKAVMFFYKEEHFWFHLTNLEFIEIFDIGRLEDIGFYTLSNNRAKNVSFDSNLERCELVLTDRCNFKCVYCRGIKKDLRGDISLEEAKHIVDLWCDEGKLKNIRFSGGEPTIWKNLLDIIRYTKNKDSINHIALSTNGSANLDYYLELNKVGVNDFSISLDACCSMTADIMAGVNSNFSHISKIIKELSKVTYVTVGVVLNEKNDNELEKIINYATSLGVSDIRIIPSAQSDHKLNINYINSNYKILNYRINNIKKGRHVRGIRNCDCNKCHLVKDDMAILHGEHFPCIIYMREQGKSIGDIKGKSLKEIKKERKNWFNSIDTRQDPICKKNCLDVCIDHNNYCEWLIKAGLK